MKTKCWLLKRFNGGNLHGKFLISSSGVFKKNSFTYVFYFWLHWVFVAVHELPLVQ